MQSFSKTLLASAMLSAAVSANAAANLQITEIYFGLDGDDGTADWFEVTNFGDATIELGSLWYDDESADLAVADPISTLSLNPGQSAVVLIGTAADIGAFEAVWGTGIALAYTDGAGLGQSGDTVNVFDGNQPGALLLDSAGYPNVGGTNLATWAIAADGSGLFTQPGDVGAYLSNPFANAVLGGGSGEVRLLGSPGVAPVPLPPALVLFGAGLLPLLRRYRS